MTFKTKKRTGEVRLMQNKQQIDDSLQRRARLQRNLTHFVGIGELCEQFAIDLAKKAGVSHG